jgi:large subunit ribosomal protein L29
MKQEVIKELSTADIVDRLEEERKHLTKLRMNHAVSPLENPHQISDNKKTIARLETELRKRAIENENTK